MLTRQYAPHPWRLESDEPRPHSLQQEHNCLGNAHSRARHMSHPRDPRG